MIAWQTSLDENLAPERLVKFGRVRHSVSVAIIEDDQGYRIESRVGRRLVERINIGHNSNRVSITLEEAWRSAVAIVTAPPTQLVVAS